MQPRKKYSKSASENGIVDGISKFEANRLFLSHLLYVRKLWEGS